MAELVARDVRALAREHARSVDGGMEEVQAVAVVERIEVDVFVERHRQTSAVGRMPRRSAGQNRRPELRAPGESFRIRPVTEAGRAEVEGACGRGPAPDDDRQGLRTELGYRARDGNPVTGWIAWIVFPGENRSIARSCRARLCRGRRSTARALGPGTRHLGPPRSLTYEQARPYSDAGRFQAGRDGDEVVAFAAPRSCPSSRRRARAHAPKPGRLAGLRLRSRCELRLPEASEESAQTLGRGPAHRGRRVRH